MRYFKEEKKYVDKSVRGDSKEKDRMISQPSQHRPLKILICLLMTFCMFCFPLNASVAENISEELKMKGNSVTIAKNIPKKLNLRAKFSYGEGKLDIHGKIHRYPIRGFRLEVFRGIEIPTVPGLDVEIGVSFLNIGSDNTFSVDIEPDENLTFIVPCEMEPSMIASIVMARYSYNFDVSNVQIGVENGIGIGFLRQRIFWSFRDPTGGPAQIDGDIEREDTVKPVFDGGLKINFPLGKHSRIGLIFNGLTIPIEMTISGRDSKIYYGPCGLNTIMELGLDYRVTF